MNELLPGLLREMAGCHVEEYDAFGDVIGLEMKVKAPGGAKYGALALADVLVPEGEAVPEPGPAHLAFAPERTQAYADGWLIEGGKQ